MMVPQSAGLSCVLLTGTSGAGKSSVAGQMTVLLAAAGVSHAVMDLDGLGFFWPAPAGDPYNHRMKAANLRSLTANYISAGIRRFVLTGMVPDIEAVRHYTRALDGARLPVIRLTADLTRMADRLSAMHADDEDRLRYEIYRAKELGCIFDDHLVADAVIDTSALFSVDVAHKVLDFLEWIR